MNMYYGIYGGRYVPITLLQALHELERAYQSALMDIDFETELMDLLKHYVGRESPLYYAKRLSEYCGGARIYLKREDLNHTGAHKINNCIGQALLAKRMGKKTESQGHRVVDHEQRSRRHEHGRAGHRDD